MLFYCWVWLWDKWDINLNELVIPGYNIFSNDLNTNSRGIIIYVSQDLTCKQIDFNNNFSEFSLLEIACKENMKGFATEAHLAKRTMT